MALRSTSSACAGAALILLAGCSSNGTFPSLAPRPFELKAAGAEPAAPSPAPPVAFVTPSDPALLSRIATSLSKAEAGNQDFETALVVARRAASSGGGRGSEAWIGVQMQISRLERIREKTTNALAALDDEKRQMLLAKPSEDRQALENALLRVQAIDTTQRSATRELIALLGRR
jgi:hypothetical protein